MALSPQCVPLLRDIIAGTQSPQGFMFVNPKSPIARTLLSNGFVQSNPATVDPTNADKIAFRATTAGYAELPIDEQPAINQGVQTIVAPPAHPASPPAAPAWNGTQETTAMQTAQAQPAAPAARGGPRGPRIAPTVAPISGFRFTVLPEGAKRGAPGSGPGESYPFSKLGAPDTTGVDSFFVHPTEANPAPFKLVRQAVNSANKRHKDNGRTTAFKAVDMPADPEHNKPGVRVFRVA